MVRYMWLWLTALDKDRKNPQIIFYILSSHSHELSYQNISLARNATYIIQSTFHSVLNAVGVVNYALTSIPRLVFNNS